VFCSDATVVFLFVEQGEEDPGTHWTARFAVRFERPCLCCDPRTATAAPEIIRWLSDIEREQARPVRWLNVAGPSERQLRAAIGDSECDRFLRAARAVIIEVVRKSGEAIVGAKDLD
jgi:hypothetical protein